MLSPIWEGMQAGQALHPRQVVLVPSPSQASLPPGR